MKGKATSRRDDMISLCYILLVLFNDNRFPQPDGKGKDDQLLNLFYKGKSGGSERFKKIMEIKQKYGLKALSQNLKYMNFDFRQKDKNMGGFEIKLQPIMKKGEVGIDEYKFCQNLGKFA